MARFSPPILTAGLLCLMLTAPAVARDVQAASCATFLSSLGVNTHVDQGYNADLYMLPLEYLGVRNIRDGSRHLPSLIMLHERTGIHVDLAGGDDLDGALKAAHVLAKAGALLSLEGPNEPNNFPITYKGKKGGGSGSWMPVAEFQRDLYRAVKSDPELKACPVFHVSEGGAETDNVGMQFLTVPKGANILVPDGTKFADYANPHNYVSAVHGGLGDNQAWNAADPVLNDRWDGLYGDYGRTWHAHFKGYSNTELQTLPRVTTETGWSAATPAEERTQGVILVNTYLAQFKRGWRYTFIYELGEGEGGGGNQGLFHKDWTAKLAANYIHNLTTILADQPAHRTPGQLAYKIPNEPATVHDLLLQKSDGTFELVVWGEQVAGSNDVTIELAKPQDRVAVYDTTVGTEPVQLLRHVTKIPLTLGDHALIVEIR